MLGFEFLFLFISLFGILIYVGIAALFVFLCRTIARQKGLSDTWMWFGLLGVLGILIVALKEPVKPYTYNQYGQNPQYGPGGYVQNPQNNPQYNQYQQGQQYNQYQQGYNLNGVQHTETAGTTCSFCGMKVSGDAKECPVCGSKVN